MADKNTEIKETESIVVKSVEPDLSSTIEIYRGGVKDAFDKKSNRQIDNGLSEHAAILFEQMFEHAQSKIRIFCKNLAAKVFDKDAIVTSAQKAVERGVAFEIVIQDENPEKSKFYEFLKTQSQNDKVSLHRLTSERLKDHTANFTVMDEAAYRYENNRDEFVAEANANSPPIAKLLISKFEAFKPFCDPLIA